MQRNVLVFFWGIAFAFKAMASNPATLLRQADSLFEKGKYKEAGWLYKQLIEQHRVYSPQMLAKAAFIAEGSHSYDEALYYLSLLYSKEQSQALYNKITDLAAHYNLPGYDISEKELIIYLLKRYLPYFGIALLAITAIVIRYALKRMRKKKNFLPLAMGWFAFSIGFIYALHKVLSYQTAIVRLEKAFVMSAPAAGSELLLTAQKGRRFRVTGNETIWYRVNWNDKTGYIRRSSVWIIN
ncbi:MAG: hypothetical protein RMJ44_07925 [Cytophagales bacterium]|nr:hypothetical protein [Bernardetiaceae bacterium]MDW8211003.1 hypothetical protein [Cytophagales bacterium]